MSVTAALLAIAAAADAPSVADTVAAASFELCPALAARAEENGQAALLADGGFERRADAEETIYRDQPEEGRPIVAAAETSSLPVILAYWPRSRFCSVSFKGDEAETALEAALSRAAASGERIGDGEERPVVYRLRAGGADYQLIGYPPDPGDASRTYSVTVRAAD